MYQKSKNERKIIMKKNTNKTTDNKVSVKRKLIPAVAMLATSAAMLSTSTYAWFTMSKEVEIQNIQLTATTPGNVQVSLGLGQNIGVLTHINDTDSKGVELVAAPKNDSDSLDWSNNVAFYDYYKVPKLKPSSSTTGGSIFIVPDANITNVGKTVSDGTAVAAREATMTLVDSKNSPNVTPEGEDNHYIEFPVWFRTAGSEDVNLKVEVTAQVGGNDSANKPAAGAQNKLYRAARVAVLKTTDGSSWTSASNVILPKDGADAQVLANKYYAKDNSDNPLALKSASDFTSSDENNRAGDAYGTVTVYDGTSAVVTIAGKNSNAAAQYAGNCTTTDPGTTDKIYGNATCIMLRVWLEGEDKDCWNATAGQDFSINLKFTEVTP